MTLIAVTDPFAARHELVVKQLEPFCDGELQRFSDHQLLDAYDVATAWADDIHTAEEAVKSIAAEWHARYRRNLPRGGSDLASVRSAELPAQLDSTFWTRVATDSSSLTPANRHIPSPSTPSMMPTITDTPKTTAAPPSPAKLPHATYTVRGQKRALFTLGAGEDSKLLDVPAALLNLAASGQPTPDSYLVEQGLCQREATGELQALLADYLAVCERHQAIPMTVFAMTFELQAHAA